MRDSRFPESEYRNDMSRLCTVHAPGQAGSWLQSVGEGAVGERHAGRDETHDMGGMKLQLASTQN